MYLEGQPELFEAIKRERPRGPLVTSHMRGRRDVAKPCRYDFVLVSPDINVTSVQYLYNEAVAAGSDHAMVVADLGLPDGPFGGRRVT